MASIALARRAFLRRTSAALLLAHGSLVAGAAGAPGRQGGPGDGEPLIRRLRLKSGAPLEAMRAFYRDRLGLMILEDGADHVTFGAGTTALTFGAVPDGERPSGERAGPLYHFAFNIPRNALRAAREWQLARTPLIPPRPSLVDPAFPDDVWHFRHWNAHSVFFYDPAFNIVEYIARHDLDTDAHDPARFGPHDILYASEIGFVVADPAGAALGIREELGLSEYPRGAAPWAMGDERGLLLCLGNLGECWAEWTPSPVTWGVFPTEAVIRGARAAEHRVKGFPYTITAEA